MKYYIIEESTALPSPEKWDELIKRFRSLIPPMPRNEQYSLESLRGPSVGNPDGSPIYPDPTDPAQKGY